MQLVNIGIPHPDWSVLLVVMFLFPGSSIGQCNLILQN